MPLDRRYRAASLERMMFSDHRRIRAGFRNKLAPEFRSCARALERTFQSYWRIRDDVAPSARTLRVLEFTHTALDALLTASHLLALGMFRLSVANSRLFIEATAMALLCSTSELTVLEQFDRNPTTYAVQKSPAILARKSVRKALNISDKSWQSLQSVQAHCDKYSHASALAIGSHTSFGTPGRLYFLAALDPGKLVLYRAELVHIEHEALILATVIDDLRRSLRSASARRS